MEELAEMDRRLAQQYGSFASYRTEADPVLVESYGDSPDDEVDRLLDVFAQSGSIVLDLGCGAGHTLCRLAPRVTAIWGFDQKEDLLEAARRRAESLALSNVVLVSGNVALPNEVDRLPNATFDLVYSRRGPDLNSALLPKLKAETFVIQELYQDPLGLKELFGRRPFLPEVGANPHGLVHNYRWLGLIPVSVKDYFFEEFFRDSEHLAEYLRREAVLWSWGMPDLRYDEMRDRAALDLYARYNTTPLGVRLLSHRKVYLFRRAVVHRYPAIPDAEATF